MLCVNKPMYNYRLNAELRTILHDYHLVLCVG